MLLSRDRIEQAKSRVDCTDKFIVCTADTCSGSPRLHRTRLRVREIIDMIKNGEENIIYKDYPDVTEEEVDACVVYYLSEEMNRE